MKNIKYYIIYIFIGLIISKVLYNYNFDNNIIIKTSTKDGKEYFVLNYYNSLGAANQLADINLRMKKLFDECSNDDSEDHSESNKRMIEKYNFDKLSELSPTSKYTAYSLNKGEKIKLCLRDNDNNLINNINLSMFVMCHELSHLKTKEEQHPPIFWDNMIYLLKKASDCGVYKPADYKKNPVYYGHNIINNNPMFKEEEESYPYIN